MANYLSHQDVLAELINLVNAGDWTMASAKALEWQNHIEGLLLMRFCEPNKVHEDFELLRMRLNKNMPDSIKAKEVREAIAKILDKISEFGIAISRDNETDGSRMYNKLINLLRLIDYTYSDLLISSEVRVKERLVRVDSLKDYLFSLEEAIRNYNPEKSEIRKMKSIVLSKITEFKSSLNSLLIPGKEKKDSVHNAYTMFIDAVGKFADVINAKSDEEVNDILDVFEVMYNVELGRTVLKDEGGYEELVPTAPGPSPSGTITESEIEWVDEEWENILQHPRVFLIIGHRNGGKTALSHALAEYYAKKYNLRGYLVNMSGKRVPPDKLKLLPKWMTVIDNPHDAPTNCVILYDEAYLRYHARTTYGSEAPQMDKLIELARQKRHTMIYVVQQTSKIDRNIISGIDALFIKHTTIFRAEFEREEIKSMIMKALEAFKKVQRKDDVRKYVYVISVDPEYPYEGLKMNGLASYWCEELSRFYEGW